MQNTHSDTSVIADIFAELRAAEDAAYARYRSANDAFLASRTIDEAYAAHVEMRAAEHDLALAVIVRRDLDPNHGYTR